VAPLSLEVDRGEAGISPSAQFGGNDADSLAAQRTRLPIARLRDQLLYLVEQHSVTVVVGATGCGKTTQLPQYLLEAGWAAGGRCIACTQPRRVACQNVALRVAEERGCALGGEVGYSIRFEEVCSRGTTSILFVTDGTLLRELLDGVFDEREVMVIEGDAQVAAAFSALPFERFAHLIEPGNVFGLGGNTDQGKAAG
jgi:ATP-dependent RNA helicase DDX35